jgi:predicted transcriptional regulator
MRRKTFSLDKTDKKIIKLLISVGLAKNLAKVLVFFFKMKETISAQLERALGLRQPEVSLVLRALEQKGWIIKSNIRKERKGRPTYAYRLVFTPQKIIAKIERRKMKELKKIRKNLELLRALVLHFSE